MTQHTTEIEKVKIKIRAMVLRTVENGCTEAEAFAAFKKIGELLEQYSLSMSEVELRDETYQTGQVVSNGKARRPINWCVREIAAFCNCKVWFNYKLVNSKTTLVYHFFGIDTDVMMAKYLYSVIDTAIETELKNFKYSREYRHAKNAGETKSATTSFQHGMTRRISARLSQMIKERSPNNGTNFSGTGTSLVLIKEQLLEENYKIQFGSMKITKSTAKSSIRHGAGYHAGKIAGDRVNLSRPISSDTSKSISHA